MKFGRGKLIYYFFLLLVSSLTLDARGNIVSFPFSTVAYLPFAVSEKYPEANITLLPAQNLNKLVLDLASFPDLVITPIYPGLYSLLVKKGYDLKYVVLWRASAFLVPFDMPNLKIVYTGCKEHVLFLKTYRKLLREDFQIKFNPSPLLLNRLLAGESFPVVVNEPCASLILKLFPGRFLPYEVFEIFIKKHFKLHFPVEGLPVGGIFVKRDYIGEMLPFFVRTAAELNKRPERFSPLIAKGFREYFHKKFTQDVIMDSLQSGRAFFKPVKVDLIRQELHRYFEIMEEKR